MDKELEAQIEKMKCCDNCEHFDFAEPNYCNKGVYREHLLKMSGISHILIFGLMVERKRMETIALLSILTLDIYPLLM